MAFDHGVNPYDPSTPTDADWVKHAAAEMRAMKIAFMKQWVPKLVNELTYTVLAEDIGQLIVMRNGGTITVPTELPFGLFGVSGLQTTRVVSGDVAQTLIVPPSLTSTLYEDYAFAVCMRVSASEWLLSGNLMFAMPAIKGATPDRTTNPVTELGERLGVAEDEIANHEIRITTLEG